MVGYPLLLHAACKNIPERMLQKLPGLDPEGGDNIYTPRPDHSDQRKTSKIIIVKTQPTSRWQWGPETRFSAGNSSTGDRGWERFTPHGETNGENSLPIGSGGFGDVPYVPVPETRVPAPLINKYKYIEYGCRGTMIEKLRM